MTKRYEKAPDDVLRKIAQLREEWYGGKKDPFEMVTIGAMFVHDEDAPDEPTLTHRGYPAAALARVVGLRDRAAGLPDAQVIIDRATWLTLTAAQQIAVLDHEVYHLELKFDRKGNVKFDSHGRPKLGIRLHDWEFGWFDEIVKRHGADAIERMQAKALVAATGQLYFPFYGEPMGEAA
jgi:hypothetical protein